MAKTTSAAKRPTTPSTLTSNEPVVKLSIPAEQARKTVTTCKTVSPGPKASPSNEQIAARAYEIWLAKGRPCGQDIENWKQAESELRSGCALTNAA